MSASRLSPIKRAMKFSIITPSFRSSEWLKLCIASVADQAGVDVEHIIQDSCSDDGTGDWLPRDPRVKAFIEKDSGMYDAVNRGLRRASGDICAYLNCDEQYLPGALAEVLDYFRSHSDVEVVFSHAVVVDGSGFPICCRKALLPQRAHSMVSHNLAILTCGTFFRRSIFERRHIWFPESNRVVGDAVWVLQLLESSVQMGVLDRVTSTFTETGSNLALSPAAKCEQDSLFKQAPRWAQVLHRAVIWHYRARKFFSGAYSQKPIGYQIYTREQPASRKPFKFEKITGRWRRKSPETA